MAGRVSGHTENQEAILERLGEELVSVSYRVVSGSGEEATVERTEVTESTVEEELTRLQRERHAAVSELATAQKYVTEFGAKVDAIDAAIAALNARR